MTRLILFTAVLVPAPAFAAFSDFKSFVGILINLLSLTIPVIVALALLIFFWGIFLFVRNVGDEGAREEGKKLIIWGLIALFVMVAFFGLVRIVSTTFFGSSSGDRLFYPNPKGPGTLNEPPRFVL